MKFKMVMITMLGVCIGWSTLASAAQNKKSEPAGFKRIPKLLRESGFKHKTASWTTVMTQTDDAGKSTTSDSKVWISGDKYRMETKDKQNGKTMVFLDDGKDVYMFNPDEKTAYQWGPAAEKMFGQIMSSDMVSEAARQRKKAKKTGSETVEGKPCTIYSYKTTVTFMNNAVTSDVKEWCWAKENFALKTQVKTPKHQMKIVFMTQEVPASETVSVIKDLVLDKSLDESLFVLPAGTKVETLEIPEGAAGDGAEGTEATQKKKSASGESAQGGDEAQQKEPPPNVKNMLKGLY